MLSKDVCRGCLLHTDPQETVRGDGAVYFKQCATTLLSRRTRMHARSFARNLPAQALPSSLVPSGRPGTKNAKNGSIPKFVGRKKEAGGYTPLSTVEH